MFRGWLLLARRDSRPLCKTPTELLLLLNMRSHAHRYIIAPTACYLQITNLHAVSLHNGLCKSMGISAHRVLCLLYSNLFL